MTRLLAVYDGNNALIMRFEYADARMPFAMTMGGALYYLAYDQVGSLRVVADGSGNPVKRIDYDSFGNIITETNPTMKIPFGFAGGMHDRDTGLVRFGYRDYDPDTGRWTAKDPIGFAGGDTDLYGYCVNDPVNLVDPEGLTASCPSSPPNNDKNWIPYKGDTSVFHCGFACFHENRKAEPGNPKGECCYDNQGVLVDDKHKYSKCKGTPNQYEDKDPRHIFNDGGGILQNGWDAYKESQRYKKEGIKKP